MPRRVFFSFHYEDVTRVNIVRNSDQFTREYTGTTRFHDASLWEKTKQQGGAAIRRLINSGLKNTSVTCVLIGQETWQRPWVRYEIIKSFARGNGLFGIRIHDVGFGPKQQRLAQAPVGRGGLMSALPLTRGLMSLPPPPPEPPPPPPGPDPFDYLGFWADQFPWGDYSMKEIGANKQWQSFRKLPSVPKSDIGWPNDLTDGHRLSEFFPVYNWETSAGSGQLEEWVERAATLSGR